jgi:hypothetical protein
MEANGALKATPTCNTQELESVFIQMMPREQSFRKGIDHNGECEKSDRQSEQEKALPADQLPVAQ